MKNDKTKQNIKTAVTATLITVGVLLVDAVRIKFLGSGCLMKAIFDIGCPACGMTRAFFSVMCLDLRMAFVYNPAWWTVPIAALACLMSFLDKKRIKLWACVFCAAIAVILLVWVFRVATGTTV